MSFLSRLFGRAGAAAGAAKTSSSTATGTRGKIVVRRPSPIAVADFTAKQHTEPTIEELWTVINRNYDQREAEVANERQSLTTAQQQTLKEERDMFTRRVFFDVRYRCGCRGRCMTGVLPCRLPSCFHWRPIVKGGEVFASRMQIETSPLAQRRYGEIVALCREERLDDADIALSKLIAAKAVEAKVDIDAGLVLPSIDPATAQPPTAINDSASAASVHSAARSDASDQPHPPQPIEQPSAERAATAGTKTSPLIEEIVALGIWRAAILVNLQRDRDAVSSLLKIALVVPQEYAETAVGTAASWACLNDMEGRFYRMHDGEFEPIDPVVATPSDGVTTTTTTLTMVSRKSTLPELLPTVIAACGTNPGFLEHTVNNVFGLVVTAIIARAQTSQDSGDTLEDPMGSSIVADDVRALRSLGATFWEPFERLALMPPLPPPRPGEATDPAEADTPRYVLDALGRSMLLHHIAASYGKLPGASPNGDVSRQPGRTAEESLAPLREAAAAKGVTGKPRSADEYVAMPLRQRHCVTRMQELLMIVKNFQGAAGGRQPTPQPGH